MEIGAQMRRTGGFLENGTLFVNAKSLDLFL
jgi:hypothetical protein